MDTLLDAPRDVVLLLPGQGAQYPRMAAGLYDSDPAFTDAVDRCLALFPDGELLRDDWLAEQPAIGIDDVRRAQPLLFTLDYALGRMVLSWGVRPAALLGHSVGELAAATLAGVFTLEDAVAVMHDRVTRIAPTEPGGMLTVAGTPDDLRPFLARHPHIAIGARNAPRQTVLAGLSAPLRAIAADLRGAGITTLPVAAHHPFHSPVLAPLFRDLTLYRRITAHPPLFPLWSAFTRTRLEADTVADPALWAGHPVAPVHFWPTLDKLLSTGRHLLLETGPGKGLTTIACRHRSVKLGRHTAAALLPARPRTPDDDRLHTDRARELLHTTTALAPQPA
ncbi:acyltransferase domain-containing protein [Streptomyces pristinaespiralis]|uniref:Acyl transferase domain-containing protein n=2 Tax=Streptomyces pristinaespiralis TaxID=38300 RepID=B5HIU7_STRE2|nr:acyltransferase domain-containing protein [Streptomyces pristinaespiralis]ALC18569.1 polyketide synthase [Streptomyces pristinaespiralis]ALC25396.1 polyketide synthase [Streptomyces pristinaespiralis]EDY66758.1 acyl transferase domain-containing protein [Streptomyces pristinaespiralis ATCC 25486]QMU12390.1 acyltransferase domain-containing protein [Streptomyces pristinaespiralis]CBW45712.1 putative acyltransferase [Streptomyces pristinaespiralis]